jgi:CBS domain-containing protein
MRAKHARKTVDMPAPRPLGKRPDSGQGRRKAVGRSAAYRASQAQLSQGAAPSGGARVEESRRQERSVPEIVSVSEGAEAARQGSAEQSQEQERWSCREVMSENPMCCLPSDPVDVAARLMVTEDIGSLPVVGDLQTTRLVGIITDRDLTVKVVAEGRDPKGIIVEEVMTPEPVTCHVEDHVQHALTIMAKYQVRRVPVIDDHGCLVGIIAQADIATRLAEPERTAQVVEEISRASTLRDEQPSKTRH